MDENRLDKVWEYTEQNLKQLHQNENEFLMAAKEIFNDLNTQGIFNDINPRSYAAALTYVICICLGKKVTQFDVYKISNITMQTIQIISKNFYKTVKENIDFYWEVMESR